MLCVGQAGGRSELCLERVAINVQDARIRDNDGKQPIDRPVVKDGPRPISRPCQSRPAWRRCERRAFRLRCRTPPGPSSVTTSFIVDGHRPGPSDPVPRRLLTYPLCAGAGRPSRRRAVDGAGRHRTRDRDHPRGQRPAAGDIHTVEGRISCRERPAMAKTGRRSIDAQHFRIPLDAPASDSDARRHDVVRAGHRRASPTPTDSRASATPSPSAATAAPSTPSSRARSPSIVAGEDADLIERLWQQGCGGACTMAGAVDRACWRSRGVAVWAAESQARQAAAVPAARRKRARKCPAMRAASISISTPDELLKQTDGNLEKRNPRHQDEGRARAACAKTWRKSRRCASIWATLSR